jgi:hypothetical protein
MTHSHTSPLAVVAAVLLSGGLLRAADPPDRLEKKPRPAEQKPLPGAPDKRIEDKATDKPADDAAKLREEIAHGMQSAEKKLKDRDPGRDTQQLQDRVLRNIDKLLDLARNPPPSPPQQPPMDGGPPPMGGDGKPMDGQQPQGKSQPQAGIQQQSGRGPSRKKMREQRRQQMQHARTGRQPRPQPGGQAPQQAGAGQPTPSPTRAGSAGPTTKAPPDRMADVVKGIWGHLPESLRQEVDHYYRDRFMPRYRDLLQEYYGRLAERDRSRREDRR